MNDDIFGLLDLYLFFAIGFSIWMAFRFEMRFKARLPHTRPYKWGFYMGWMGILCAPIALLLLSLTVMHGEDADIFGVFVMGVWFLAHSVCGFFIVRRKQWAWVVGTILLLNPIAWIINGIYARNRWKEFAEEAGDFPLPSVPHPDATTPAVPPSLPTSAPGNEVFFVAIRGQRQGPYTLGQLRTMWSSGQAPADTQYWQNGMTTWYPLIELLERAK
jgi:hypothetical protein